MATIEWPSSLPQSPLIDGFSDEPQNSVLRSDMDGLTKQRNRYNAVIHDVRESYWLTPTQFNTFKSFYFDALGNGAEEFLKPDPIEEITAVYRFSGVYEFEFNGVNYRVTLPLEKLP